MPISGVPVRGSRQVVAQSGGSLRCKSGAAFWGAADAAAGRRVTDRPTVLSAVSDARKLSPMAVATVANNPSK